MNKTPAYEVARRWGYLRNEEIDLIFKIVSGLETKTPRIVNIGSGTGTSGLALRGASPSAEIYTIDKSPGGPLGGLENEVHVFDEFHMKLPNQILSDSGEAGKKWANGPVDVVVIDGDHLAPGVERDIRSWNPHVKSGGYVLFHDYGDAFWPAVKEVSDRLMKELGYVFVESAQKMAAFKKTAETAATVKPAPTKKVKSVKKA